MGNLLISGPCVQRELELGLDELRAAPEEFQVADVGALVAGRAGQALRLAAVAELAGAAGARFVHVASAGGDFTANIPIEQALSGGLVLYAHEGQALPRQFGGPFRLLFPDSEDCSVNVKFLERVEFLTEPGSHTARCSD